MRAFITSLAFILGLFFLVSGAHGFKLSPQGAAVERALVKKDQGAIDKAMTIATRFGIDKIGEPVHEEITNRILGCEGDASVCSDGEWDSGAAYVLAGVRWNDDPPFEFTKGHGAYRGCKYGNVIRLVTFTECWARVFEDGKSRASRRLPIDRSTSPILIRSHFGDLQFLHAMASADGESPAETRRKLMTWLEFTWKVATQKIRTDETLVEVNVPGMKEVFRGHGWNVQDLFAQGNPHIRKPRYMAEFAFGSLLHVVQDSFSSAHVRREKPVNGRMCPGLASDRAAPGRILEFHSYVNQDDNAHGAEDSRLAFSAHWSDVKPSIIDVGRVLHDQFERQQDWESVQPYISCIFQLAPIVSQSSPGDRFLKQ